MRVLSVRYSPELDKLITETRDFLQKEELRPVTTTDIVQDALAVFHSLVTSGNIRPLILQNESMPELTRLVRKNLASARGLKVVGDQ